MSYTILKICWREIITIKVPILDSMMARIQSFMLDVVGLLSSPLDDLNVGETNVVWRNICMEVLGWMERGRCYAGNVYEECNGLNSADASKQYNSYKLQQRILTKGTNIGTDTHDVRKNTVFGMGYSVKYSTRLCLVAYLLLNATPRPVFSVHYSW